MLEGKEEEEEEISADLLWCPYSPRVESHALTSVRMLKIPSIGSHTSVRTHENTEHTVRNG